MISWLRALVVMGMLHGLVRAEVPSVLDYEFEWSPRPEREQIETYWLWRRVPPAPIWTLAGMTTNRGSIWVSNVTTLIAYEWALSSSNRLGLSDPGNIVPTPANPRPVTTMKPVRVRMRVTPPSIIEQGPVMGESTARFILIPSTNGTLVFTYCLQPEEPMMFWRWRTMTNATLSAPLPR